MLMEGLLEGAKHHFLLLLSTKKITISFELFDKLQTQSEMCNSR